ncbi:acyltransferase [Nonomuraea sp. MG754425]|uniref:2-oxo acid dehydrogenase subunit E2 n=1 Tax=Nonomuraea sp. MG754425 TaxID=2570319 RepID=UPI001F01CFA1|nr:2-oxo acid dehydrogenase subunit E2 [Nonomuraea sp. MG754425]MCF6472392.1 acyltransferase [Nonomuraea sp. MG754425]
MHEVAVPRLNANDETYLLVEWLCAEGQWVRHGEPIAVVETSKTATEVTAERDGILHHVRPARSECRHNDVLALLFPGPTPYEKFRARRDGDGGDDEDGDGSVEGPVLTNSARLLADAHGVSAERLRNLGKRVIKRADVARVVRTAEPEPEVERRELPRNQRAVAEVVSESHRTIPPGFVAVKVNVDRALACAGRLAHRTRRLIGLPELVVKAIGWLPAQFPLFFVTPLGDNTVRPATGAHVGLTIDVGNGLFVPVVREVGQLGITRISEILLDYRTRAVQDRGFGPGELSDANIVLALHNDPDVVLAGPLVHPGHVCVVGLAGICQELALDDEGAVAPRKICNLGLTYDHRLVNGGDAVRFLRAIKTMLEAPEELDWEGDG